MKDTNQNQEVLRCQLYLISPPKFEVQGFSANLIAALATRHVSCFQLRLKGADDGDILNTAKALLPICRDYEVPFILNDRPDLAAQLEVEGTHVGQDDMNYKDARRWLGNEAIVGMSCYDSTHMAMVAAESGADYVAFGAFFPTTTKRPKTQATPQLLSSWQQTMTVPCVAIGGITVHNCPLLIKAGADFLAVVSGVWDHPDGASTAVHHFNNLCLRS
ncbi:MAG: thiamine phosphate synthase [Pseudomonadota bacterium]|nr:thiamine phosphate synthase [Pseudomonadota bacterium]